MSTALRVGLDPGICYGVFTCRPGMVKLRQSGNSHRPGAERLDKPAGLENETMFTMRSVMSGALSRATAASTENSSRTARFSAATSSTPSAPTTRWSHSKRLLQQIRALALHRVNVQGLSGCRLGADPLGDVHGGSAPGTLMAWRIGYEPGQPDLALCHRSKIHFRVQPQKQCSLSSSTRARNSSKIRASGCNW